MSFCKLYHFHNMRSDGRCQECGKQIITGRILLAGEYGNIWYLDVPSDDPLEKYAVGVVTYPDMRQTKLNKRLEVIRHLHDELDISFRQIGEMLGVSHVAVSNAYRRAVSLSTDSLQGKVRRGNIEATSET